MPLYDMACEKCGTVEEHLVPNLETMTELEEKGIDCTRKKCKGKLRRLPSKAAFGIGGVFVTKLGYGNGSTARDNGLDDFDDFQVDR